MRICRRNFFTLLYCYYRQLDEGGFFIARRTTFRTLQELVEHYSRDPDGLCVNLRNPCAQVGEFWKTKTTGGIVLAYEIISTTTKRSMIALDQN